MTDMQGHIEQAIVGMSQDAALLLAASETPEGFDHIRREQEFIEDAFAKLALIISKLELRKVA